MSNNLSWPLMGLGRNVREETSHALLEWMISMHLVTQSRQYRYVLPDEQGHALDLEASEPVSGLQKVHPSLHLRFVNHALGDCSRFVGFRQKATNSFLRPSYPGCFGFV